MVTALSNIPKIHFNGTPTQCLLFGHTVEVLQSIHSLHRTNAVAEERNSNFRLEADIFYHAIEHLMQSEAFSHEQLIIYFQTQISLEEFHRTLPDELQVTFEAHLPYAVDFLLLGMSSATYTQMEKEERAYLHQQYEILLWELLQKDLGLTEFIGASQNLFVEYVTYKQSV
ncbi:hypothetical protein ACI6PS_00975 [Flavobacterium sp. PLA-1-15]|uniref:hypothetical protein n=1 Tax=Flavobacterium sp. PLA-1-15 TaxID=3380533 RepID=UPI003B7D9D02